MRRAVAGALALALAGGCGHRLGVDLPATCRAGNADACAGWALDLAYVGANDLRYDDDELDAYVSSVAQKIARAAGLAHVTVRLLDSDEPEASALGGDLVYVDRGVLARLGSEAELAALLGHEVTHLVARHTADLLHSDEDAGMSEDERLRRRDDDEALADERAVAWVEAAGYDPGAVLSMMRAIDRGDDGSPPAPGVGLELTRPESDHPPVAIRLARIARLVAARRGGVVRAREYLAEIEGLVVGDDPRRGRLADHAWVRARSRIAIDVPDGWKATGDAQLELTAPDGAQIHVGVVERSWGDLMQGVLDDPRPRRIAHRPAVIGTVRPTDDAAGGRAGTRDDARIKIDADARGSPIALVELDGGARELVISTSGTHARAHLLAFVGRVRDATGGELAASAPHRLRLHAAPRAGAVGALLPAVCAEPEIARVLDDAARVVAAGDPLKCADR